MAIYDTLPVYKVSYDFLLDLFKFTKNFDREYKYTLGDDSYYNIIKQEIVEENPLFT